MSLPPPELFFKDSLPAGNTTTKLQHVPHLGENKLRYIPNQKSTERCGIYRVFWANEDPMANTFAEVA
jgi:hypothetical protein